MDTFGLELESEVTKRLFKVHTFAAVKYTLLRAKDKSVVSGVLDRKESTYFQLDIQKPVRTHARQRTMMKDFEKGQE